jgi:hypothetical protein
MHLHTLRATAKRNPHAINHRPCKSWSIREFNSTRLNGAIRHHLAATAKIPITEPANLNVRNRQSKDTHKITISLSLQSLLRINVVLRQVQNSVACSLRASRVIWAVRVSTGDAPGCDTELSDGG